MQEDVRPLITDRALEVQRAYMRSVRKANYRPQSYYIVTLGCQMNVRDSETLAGMLEEMGYQRAASREQADLILYNTCCVRENAENRALGNVIWLKELKKLKPRLLICVGGCMMQEKGMAETLKRQYPFIDLIFGTHNLHRFPELLFRVIHEEKQVCEVLDSEGGVAEGLPVRRTSPHMAFINIMYGCNNFCSYCIVPYVRGREKSRTIEEVVDEVGGLVRAGVREVTLLGQNVNSFGRDRYGHPRFAELLRQVGDTGIERIRFTSSHPKDLLPETIDAMAEVPSVMPQLHLAVQSGSTRILKEMNRRYTREQYLDLIDRIRDRIPGIALSTDIIVGFPGETEEDFLETLSLAQTVGYAQAFTFIYSRREGTPAARIEDPTPREVIQNRFDRLVKVIEGTAYDFNQQALGRTIPVLVEGFSKKDAHMLQGKSPKNQTVHAPLREGWTPEDVVGHIVDVEVDRARTWYLSGTVAGEPR